MIIGKFKPYRQMLGTIEMINGEHCGRLLNITGFVSYTANSLEELESEFHKAVDNYFNMLGSYS